MEYLGESGIPFSIILLRQINSPNALERNVNFIRNPVVCGKKYLYFVTSSSNKDGRDECCLHRWYQREYG
jgi:hypothetical protein